MGVKVEVGSLDEQHNCLGFGLVLFMVGPEFVFQTFYESFPQFNNYAMSLRLFLQLLFSHIISGVVSVGKLPQRVLKTIKTFPFEIGLIFISHFAN